jgi:basic amino acid/polyamine antiporter, APA family
VRQTLISLVKTLRLGDLVLLIVGTVMGSGLFVVPAMILRQVNGRPLAALAAWLTGGTLSLLGAITYGELTAMNPQAGGLYVYIRDAYGRLPAFLYGWSLFFMISSGAVAAISVAFSAYLGRLVHLTHWEAQLTSAGLIVLIAIVNVRGTRQATDIQNWGTVLKVTAILVMGVVLIWLGRSGLAAGPRDAELGHHPLVNGFGLALMGVLWVYEGWQYCTFSAGETVNPQKDFPRAFIASLLVLTTVFLVVNAGYLAALGPTKMALSQGVAAEAVSMVLGNSAAKIISVVALISTFGTINGLTVTSPRVYYAMAQDGLFFRALAELHPRFRTPATAIIVASAWAGILAMSGTFEQLLTIVMFTAWIFYALVAASLFVYRRRTLPTERPYSVPFYPFAPALFVLAAAASVIDTVITSPIQASLGIALVVTGVPVYMFWQRTRLRMEAIPQRKTSTPKESS